MELVVYSQYYRTCSPGRQIEIDECLRRNLNHPGISRMVLFCESDAPPVPQGTVPVEVISSDERITYAEWFRWVQRQGSGIGLLLNADIYLDEGLEHLTESFNTPEAFLALTRYNPGNSGFHLNDYPHWTQDVWGVRADAELPESLLYASSFPLGFPGCDNRIAYVMWSHGFRVRNPCYHVRSVHLQASTARAYDKTGDRLYGGVSYVHPSLAPDEDAELEFTLWTRSHQRPAGLLINQQAIEQGVHQLRHGEAEVAQRFLDLQQFTGLSWMHEAVGSAHLQGELHPFASEDTVFLPLPELLTQGVELQLPRPTKLEGLTLRLPRRAPAGYRLELEAHGEGEAQLQLQGEAALALKAGGERRFWQPAELKGTPWQRLRLKLSGPAVDPGWRGEEGAELVLFGEEGALDQAKSLNVIAEEPQPKAELASEPPPADTAARAQSGEPVYQWRRRKDCEAQLAAAEELCSYGNRFRVLRSGDELLFDDRFWPNVGAVAIQGTVEEALLQGEEALFALGFLQPVQEWKPEQIASEKLHADHQLFWQYPCRTEEDAYWVHRELVGPQLEGDTYQVYLGLPWATFIDRGVNQKLTDKAYPETLLLAHRKRAEALAAVLSDWGKKLQVHSVCQHIFWREAIPWIRSTGVTDLWISHKEKGLDQEHGLRLRSWSLYAVNDRDPARRQGLNFVPIEQRQVFASFSGAHMKHYLSDVRQRMANLAELEGYQVTIKDIWHFNKVVYNFQVFGDESKKDAIEADEVRSYNDLLSHTRFSLCPVGAGPNTLRLWESLAVGAIPVVLSDRHELPDLERLLPGEGLSWDQVVVLHPEAEVDQLDSRLKRISAAERHRRQQLCRRVYEAAVAMTCFGRSLRAVEPLPLLQELFKPQQVQVPGESTSEFTGVSAHVPAAVRLASDGPRSIVVHMDQTEQLLGFRVEAVGCRLDELNITISRYREFNKYEELPFRLYPMKDEHAWLWLPKGVRWWAIGLELTVKWIQAEAAKEGAELRMAVLSEKDAFAREARRLDRAGILKAASNRNHERQDDTFDTKHINSALILDTLPSIASSDEAIEGNELFPPVQAPATNLIGEPLGAGITMYVHLMNRNENVIKNIGNWLNQKFDELILLDWSSKYLVSDLPGIFDDPRVRVVRVEGQSKFIRTLAQNLATRMARNTRIFKCDSDVEIKGDFFAAHPLVPGEFWTGDWHHARDENEKHLHGETYYFIQDFERVNGYDERILSYGQDDTNLKDRMVLSGLSKKVINLCYLNHQAHEDKLRTTNQTIAHPMVRTYAHRLFTNRSPLFSRTFQQCLFKASKVSPNLVRFECIDFATSKEDVGLEYEDEALDIVASWYTKNNQQSLTREEKLKAVWESSSKSEIRQALPETVKKISKTKSEKHTPSTQDKQNIDTHNCFVDFSKKQRVLILGSSVSIQKSGYLPTLKKKLDNLCIDAAGHEYLNASLGGTPSEATYCYASSNFIYDIKSFRPTLCILEKTPNDKIYHFSSLSEAQKAEKLGRIEKFLGSLLRFIQRMGCSTIVLSMYTKPDQHMNWDTSSELGYILPLYERVANCTRSPHINVAQSLLESYSVEQINGFLLDDVHLNAEGASKVADIIYDQIIQTRRASPHKGYPNSDESGITMATLNSIVTGSEFMFESSLLSFAYNIVPRGVSIAVPTIPGRLVGLFYLNDPFSGWVLISTDKGESVEIRLFDHQSYLPRLHYKQLPELRYENRVYIEVLSKEVDYTEAIESYHSAKTFDPSAKWAKEKYLGPLIQARDNPEGICFKPALLIGSNEDH